MKVKVHNFARAAARKSATAFYNHPGKFPDTPAVHYGVRHLDGRLYVEVRVGRGLYTAAFAAPFSPTSVVCHGLLLGVEP